MVNSNKDIETEDKEVSIDVNKNQNSKNRFKRFKVDLEDFKIEHSNLDEKSSDVSDELDNVDDFDLNDENAVIAGTNLKDEDIAIDDPESYEFVNLKTSEKIEIPKNSYDGCDSYNNLSDEAIEEDESDKKSVSSKVKDFVGRDLKKELPTLVILSIAIGALFVIYGILILLGDSEKVVDSVSYGETATLSILVIFLGIVLIALSFLKLFSKKKNILTESFIQIKEFESEDDDRCYDSDCDVDFEDNNGKEEDSEVKKDIVLGSTDPESDETDEN